MENAQFRYMRIFGQLLLVDKQKVSNLYKVTSKGRFPLQAYRTVT
jgi:hypothetical protein